MSNIALKKDLSWESTTSTTSTPARDRVLTVKDWRDLPYEEAPLTYSHTIETWLKDSNAYTNTYFARYFEWQGVCREAWFFKCISPDMLQSIGVFITKEAHNDFVQETFPFQTIRCHVNTAVVRNASFYLVFRFFNAETNTLVSGGYQQIVFANLNRRIARLPDRILDQVREYEVPFVSVG